MALFALLPILFAPFSNSLQTTSPPFKCPPNFRNVVFNNGGQTQPGYPQPRWSTLERFGVSDWVGFINSSLSPLPSNETPLIVEHNVPRILTDPSYVDDVVNLLESDSPPAYLEMFNEPDFPWPGSGKNTTPPTTAGKALRRILKGTWPNTTLVSPALASSGNVTWWHTFNSPEGCNGCLNTTKITVMAGHFYDLDAHAWLDRVATFSGLFPDKEIWITEMAPSTRLDKNCKLSPQKMKNWMTTVVKAIVTEARFSNVKRIYWNAGEWSPFPNRTVEECNHSLTYGNGTETELLKHYSSLCLKD